ncbi:hypothetical protein BJL95_13330 [Methylomonas sp. LWB]|nr:hypothetical protein BJL95_13330 [Methylomonas sp. LWB]
MPTFPNNRDTKSILEAKHLTDLLTIYLGWKLRHITPRHRTVIVQDTLYDPHNSLNSAEFSILKEKIENGEDLIQYLSLKAQKQGYTPASSQLSSDKWSDKDFLLNVMGFHHLHFKPLPERTDNVVFARVTRNNFEVVGVFNHDVFDVPEQMGEPLNSERQKLWEIFDSFSMQGTAPNSIFVPSPISLSAHTFQVVTLAIEYVRVIKELDPKLDDGEYIKLLYSKTDATLPSKPKLEWVIRGTDIGICDKESNVYMTLRYGIN